jgi:pSer/pThr/pTyr-binding forkhead associated (FHA) protein
MQIKISIKNQKQSEYLENLVFERSPIIIGRESNCEIVLSDPRKLVSRQHAKIVVSNGEFQIIDLLSRNSTYCNGTQLDPEKEYQLNIGDNINIGEFILEVTEIEKEEIEEDDSQKTMMFSSPFAEDVANLNTALKNLSEKYSNSEDQMKSEYMRMDFLSNMSKDNYSDISSFLLEYFSDGSSAKKEEPVQSENKWGDIPIQKEVPQEPIIQPNFEESKPAVKKSSEDYSFKSQFSESFDILLESITKLIQGFWQFRQEFFGVTIYQSMPTTSVEKLKEFLFDPEISDEESAKRLELFKEELNKILAHQVGLLDGYHDSVNDGIAKVLNEIDPEILENKINSENLKLGKVNIPFKYIPLYAKIKSVQMVKSIHKKLKLDMNVIERKHFRPAFMKGYQKRSHQSKDTE